MAKAKIGDNPVIIDEDLDKLLYGNLTKADIEKYSFLIDIDINQLKETLQDLTLNYYKYYIKGDAVNFEDTAKELNKYIDLDIPAINDFINYCFIFASYSILNMLYDFDLDFYAPANPGLNIKGHRERERENTIKILGLTPGEVKEVIEYNKKSLDLTTLKDLERDAEQCDKTKYITIDKPAIEGAEGLFNGNYYGDWDLKQEMKVYIMLDLMYFGHYPVTKAMAKAVNKPIFDIIDKKVILNDAPNSSDISKELSNGGS